MQVHSAIFHMFHLSCPQAEHISGQAGGQHSDQRAGASRDDLFAALHHRLPQSNAAVAGGARLIKTWVLLQIRPKH